MNSYKNGPFRKKSLGQVFLSSGSAIRRVVDSVGFAADDHALEIGGGDGRVSAVIAPRVADLLIVEIDQRFLAVLAEKFRESQSVRIVAGDILSVSVEAEIRAAAVNTRFVVYGSIPYYITSPILRWLLEHRSLFRRAALLMQREVAQRVVAPPGNKEYGFLSVIMQLGARCGLGPVVSRGEFSPTPNVDSQVLFVDLDAADAVELGSGELRIISALFQQRRKQIGSSLRQVLDGKTIQALGERLTGTGIALSDRPEQHSPAALLALCRAVPSAVS